jgi:hypothetical protein
MPTRQRGFNQMTTEKDRSAKDQGFHFFASI